MVHPTRLLRSSSDERASQFSAPLDLVGTDQVDCGITKLPCLNYWFNLEKYATPRVFLVLLGLTGVVQGCALQYFRGTSSIWIQYFQFSNVVVDCVLYVNEIFTGICALIISFYGNKIHRASWLGGLVIYQAIAAVILILPELYRPFLYITSNTTSNLCTAFNSASLTTSIEDNVTTAVIFFCYQLIFSFASISFFAFGLTYLDDNVGTKVIPAYLGIAFSSKEIGKYFGMYLAWLPHWYSSAVFVSPVWIVLTVLTFFIGTLVAMFPRSLPSVLMQSAVVSILDVANGVERPEAKGDNADDGFWSTFYRLLKNRLLLLNIFASVFMYSAVINFEIFESYFMQSRFLVPTTSDISKFNDTWLSQIIVTLIKQPFIAVCLIASGVIISKVKPSATSLAVWNASILVVVTLLIVPHAFLGCTDQVQSDYNGRLNYFCNYRCNCDSEANFLPVCTELGQKTYYSPCHAGCSDVQTINHVKIYSNCTCGENIHSYVNTLATEGSCSSNNCFIFWSLAQVTFIVCSGLLASTLVPTIMINLRCCLFPDKAMALALVYTFVATIPFVPFKIIYQIVADSFCQYYYNGRCKLHSQHFGTFLSGATISLLIISGTLTIVLSRLVGNLELYKVRKKFYEDGQEHELEQMTSPDRPSVEENSTDVDVHESGTQV